MKAPLTMNQTRAIKAMKREIIPRIPMEAYRIEYISMAPLIRDALRFPEYTLYKCSLFPALTQQELDEWILENLTR